MAARSVMRAWRSADGLKLAARDYAGASGPARPPVICIHGLSRNSRDFEGVAPHLAGSGHRVLAVDVRGRGRSAWDSDPTNYNPGIYAGDVIALMHETAISRAVFIGSSMGGLVTMLVSAMRPDLVAGAVLNDVGPVWREAGMARILAAQAEATAAADWADAAEHARRANRHAFPDHNDAAWDRFARRLYSKGPDGAPVRDVDPAVAATLKGASPAAPAELWPLFLELVNNRPALLIRGGISEMIDDEIVESIRARAPELACVTAPGVGHAPMLDEPEVLAALGRFLRSVK